MRNSTRPISATPLAATLQLALVGVGVPAALSVRLNQEPLPLQSIDAALLVGAIVWLVVAKAVISRGDALDSRVINRLSPTWHAHRLVEQSMFGVGTIGFGRPDPQIGNLQLVAAPHALTADHLPASFPDTPGAGGALRTDAEAPRSIPVLGAEKPGDETDAIENWETEEYIVARGDTFWSIAEAILDDGRLWTSLHELNFGREVTPGRLLDDGDELRIGWSILIPLRTEQESESVV